MASGSGKWETVGGSKRNKNGNASDSKRKSEPATFVPTNPLAPSETAFGGFNRKAQEPSKKSSHDSPQSKKPKAAKKPTKPEVVHPKDVLMQMHGADLKDLIAVNNAKFDDETVQLKLLSGHLQDLFANCDPLDSDPDMSKQSPGFPLLVAAKDVQQALKSVISSLSSSMRVHYYSVCVSQLLQQAKTGGQVFGWRMLVQAITAVQPGVVIACMDHLSTLVKPCANQPRHCLALMWCFEQVPLLGVDIAGFKVWHEAYFCTLLERNMATKVQAHALDRLKALLKQAAQQPGKSSRIPYQMVMDMMELSLGQTWEPPPLVHQEVQKLYPDVWKAFTAHAHPAESVKLFEALLPQLRPQQIQSHPKLLNEVYSSLVTCMLSSDGCYRALLQIYRRNLQQSSYFLKRLCTSLKQDGQKAVVHQLDFDRLHDLLTRLESINSSLVNQQSVSQQVRQECARNCKALLEIVQVKCEEAAKRRKLFGGSRVLPMLFWSLLVLVLAIVAADVYQSKSWAGSQTRFHLEQQGVLALCQRISTEVCAASASAMKWLEVNVAPHVSRWSTDAEPYFMEAVKFCETTYAQSQVLASKAYAQAQDLIGQAAVHIESARAMVLEKMK